MEQFNFQLFFVQIFSENKPSRSELTVLVAHNDDPTDKMIILFSDQPKLGVDKIRDFSKKMVDEGVSHMIIIVQTGLTPSSHEVCEKIK